MQGLHVVLAMVRYNKGISLLNKLCFINHRTRHPLTRDATVTLFQEASKKKHTDGAVGEARRWLLFSQTLFLLRLLQQLVSRTLQGFECLDPGTNNCLQDFTSLDPPIRVCVNSSRA